MRISKLPWEEVQEIFNVFTIWASKPEMGWYQKAWKSLDAAGLTSYSNNIEKHWGILRAFAVGTMYGDYCELEWDEYFEPTLLIQELYDYEILSHVRLGAMAEAHSLDDNEHDSRSLFALAIEFLVPKVRLQAYDALVRGFEDVGLLYAALLNSRSCETNYDDLEAVASELFDEGGNQINGRPEAFAYVWNGMLAKDV